MNSLIERLEEVYRKTPDLSPSVRSIVVEILPWISGAAGILLLLSGTIDLLYNNVSSNISSGMGGDLAFLFLSPVLNIFLGALFLSAFMPLRKKQKRGWMLLFLVELLFIISPILSLHLGSIILNLVLATIGFYFLFQVKPAYK